MSTEPELGSELESFRREWISDLRSRTDHQPAGPSAAVDSGDAATSPTLSARDLTVPGLFPPSALSSRRVVQVDDGHDFYHHDSSYHQGPSFDELPPPRPSRPGSHPAPTAAAAGSAAGDKKLVSALDHFEAAMVKEAQGNMGDSLTLYRKAYKLDNGVDRRYREKHFPKVPAKPATTGTSSAQGDSQSHPQTNPAAGADEQQQQPPQSVTDLIASFSHLAIQPSPPTVEGSPPPPCPIASLPDELLVHILIDAIAGHDVADFTRLSLVCRRFAYLASAEQRIWRQVCLSSRFAFPHMLYDWAVTVEGEPVEQGTTADVVLDDEDGTVVSSHQLHARHHAAKVELARSLVMKPHVYPTWKAMFRQRPRIRFNGIYISTVNYPRAGQASTNQSTWGGAPILIVTYYRYLRFYRDGSAISLLTTTAPADVVHHLTKDHLPKQRERERERERDRDRHGHGHGHGHASLLPSALMHNALRGRWRLSSAADYPDAEPRDQESDLFVETEGVGTKYVYRMALSLRSAGRGSRNNKLTWRGFQSYNKLTDDVAEFALKNDKPFFFSRVKSYGLG